MPKRSIRNELLAQVRLSDKELGSRYELAVSEGYWRELCPHVPLDSAQALPDVPAVNHQLVEDCVNQLRTRGYFKTGPLIPESTLTSMRGCVEAVRKAGWPPVFAFIYDPFWAVTRVPFVAEFLLADLGDEFNIIMSRVWCYYVPPSRGAGGWTPHADAYSNPANRLTVWIPLTDATLDNGCMYVVPKDFAYGGAPPKRERLRLGTVSSDYALELLHSCKALPAAAGSVLGWDPQTIHWGSKCHEPSDPRISIVRVCQQRRCASAPFQRRTLPGPTRGSIANLRPANLSRRAVDSNPPSSRSQGRKVSQTGRSTDRKAATWIAEKTRLPSRSLQPDYGRRLQEPFQSLAASRGAAIWNQIEVLD